MAEMMRMNQEQSERMEQIMDAEQRDRLIEQYNKCIDDALREGQMDMVDYYREQIAPLKEARKQEQQEYWENRKQEIMEQQQKREQQWRMDKAVHGAPDYAGLGGWRESEYIYEAEKEYSKNGESAEYRRLLEGAAKAHVREKYRDILK